MIEFKMVTKRKIDLEYEEEFEFGLHTYKITRDNVLCVKKENSWESSCQTLSWVWLNQDGLIKQPQKPFWAEQDEKYYYITQDGKIDFDTFVNGCLSDVFKRKLGNCFKTDNITQEQINKYLNKLNNREIL